MKEVLTALAVGVLLGIVFGKLNLPAPVPQSLAGVVGIIGVFLGYMLGLRI